MTNEKMTIHRALSELKVIDNRISSAITKSPYCMANKHSNDKISGVSIEEFEKIIQGNYDKSVDLISRRNAIKRAVVLSNAVTKVTIGNEEYTVAEAIEMKNHGMYFKEQLLAYLQQSYNKAQATLLRENGEELSKKAEQYVIGLYGGKESKTNTDAFEKAKNDFIKANSYDLIDPLEILNKIEALEAEISKFNTDVDAILSTSNALTEIEISY